MLNLKRKYKVKSLEPWDLRGMWKIYPSLLFTDYLQMHRLRNILSRLGINLMILTYAFLVFLLVAHEVLVGDPLWRQQLLTLLLTHVVFDLLVNVEPLYIAQNGETKDYTTDLIFGCDRVTFADRIRRLRQEGRNEEADNVCRIEKAQANSSEPFQTMHWVAGFEIRHKATGRKWRIYLTDGNDYDSWVRSQHVKSRKILTNFLAIFQEMDDRQLSRQCREIVLKRLQRHCDRIEGEDAMPVAKGSDH